MEHTIDELKVKVDTEADSATDGIDKLEESLIRLKEATSGGAGLSKVAKQISSIKSILSQGALDTSALKPLESAMASLAAIPKAAGFTSTVNSLKKIPEITKQLSGAELYKFGVQMKVVANAVKPLADEMDKVARGFSAFPSRIQKLISDNEKLAVSNKKAANSFGFLGNSSLKALANLARGYVMRRAVSLLANSVEKINEYVETVNLFQVSMREFYDEAYAYAELVNDKLSVDPADWMRNQGVFMSMATGFGLAREQAYKLSESLTELTYDISSLYNEDMNRAAQRLQSALAGEIEPIRRLGISISQATLEEFAMAKGIKENVANMTEQEKALLRSIKLIEDATKIGAVGDFVKTLESPANAIRVLKQQLTQLSRAIGSVLLPAIVQVIPYVQAFVSILTDAVKWVADLAGFEMPTWDNEAWNKAITDGATDATDALDEATEAAKKLKKETLGIDELNIIGDKGNEDAGSNWASNLEIPDLWNKSVLEEMTTKMQEIKEKMLAILPLVATIATAFAAWKFGPSTIKGIKAVAELFKRLLGHSVVLSKSASAVAAALKFAGAVGVIATIVTRFNDLYENSEKFREGIKRISELFEGFKIIVSNTFEGVATVFAKIGQAALNLLPESVKNGFVNFFGIMKKGLAALDLDWKDFAIAIAGVGLLFVPGGQLLGAALLAFESLSVKIRGLGAISDETWEAMKKSAAEMWYSLKESVSNGWVAVVDFFEKALPDWWKNTVEPWFTWTRWDALLAVIAKTMLESVSDMVLGWTSRISDWWSKDVKPWFNLVTWIGLMGAIGKAIREAVSVMVTNWETAMSEWWDKHVVKWFSIDTWKDLAEDAIEGLKQGFSNILEIGKEIGESLADGINSALESVGSALSGGFSGGYDPNETEEVLWEKEYASGGFPSMGELFLARESGPELVGTIGGSSAVVNNSQIVEAVSVGVASAVASVLGGSNRDANVVVYLDGEKIYSNQKKVAARRGYDISLNPSFSL